MLLQQIKNSFYRLKDSWNSFFVYEKCLCTTKFISRILQLTPPLRACIVQVCLKNLSSSVLQIGKLFSYKVRFFIFSRKYEFYRNQNVRLLDQSTFDLYYTNVINLLGVITRVCGDTLAPPTYFSGGVLRGNFYLWRPR